jgi:hypothetical protein
MSMANSLGLDSELHGAPVLHDLEQCFGVDLMDEAADRWVTVGDVYDSLRRQFHEHGMGIKHCATALVFFRLRLVLQELDPEARPGPSQPLRRWHRYSPRRLLHRLHRRTRLIMPGHGFSWPGIIGLIFMPIAVAALIASSIFEPSRWLPPAAGILISAILVIVDPGRLAAKTATLGGLARAVAALNFRQFSRMGEERRDREIWEALLDVLTECSHLPRAEIHADTLLLVVPDEAAGDDQITAGARPARGS